MFLKFVFFHNFSFTLNFPSQPRTLPIQRCRDRLTETKLCNRQIPHSLAGCGKNSIAESGNKGRHPWLTNACRRSVAIDDVYIRLTRDLINSSYWIILKIRLVDYAFRSRNLSGSHNTGPEYRCAFKLGASRFRIHHQACVQNCIHARNPYLALIINLDLDDRCHIRQKTAVRCNPHTGTLAVLALSPPGFFRDHLRDTSQPTGFPWVSVHRSSVVGVFHTLEIDRSRLSDEIEEIIDRIAASRMRKYIREALNRKSVIDVRHRA